MRSMQLLADRLLVLSFYRTASALNVFDLTRMAKAQPGEDDGCALGEQLLR